MHSLLDPPRPPLRPPPRPTAQEVEQAIAIVDRSLHVGGLVLRAGVYLALAAIADRFDFGPHLVGGILCGDFLGWLPSALRACRQAPIANGAELVLFTILFVLWWSRYDWPHVAEFQALFCLGWFGALTGRVGMLAGTRRHADGWS